MAAAHGARRQPFMTREETSKYTDPLDDGTARQFSLVMDARSVITSPSYPQTIQKGCVEIARSRLERPRAIRRVDVSTDGGRTWKPATLQQPVLPKAHTRVPLPGSGTGVRPKS